MIGKPLVVNAGSDMFPRVGYEINVNGTKLIVSATDCGSAIIREKHANPRHYLLLDRGDIAFITQVMEEQRKKRPPQ